MNLSWWPRISLHPWIRLRWQVECFPEDVFAQDCTWSEWGSHISSSCYSDWKYTYPIAWSVVTPCHTPDPAPVLVLVLPPAAWKRSRGAIRCSFAFVIGDFLSSIKRITVLVIFRLSSHKIIVNSKEKGKHSFVALNSSSPLDGLAGCERRNVYQFCHFLVTFLFAKKALWPIDFWSRWPACSLLIFTFLLTSCIIRVYTRRKLDVSFTSVRWIACWVPYYFNEIHHWLHSIFA